MNGGRIYVPLQFEYCSHSFLSTEITGNFIPILSYYIETARNIEVAGKSTFQNQKGQGSRQKSRSFFPFTSCKMRENRDIEKTKLN